jgi:hypothetical protein
MKAIVVVLLLTGCGGDEPGPHDELDCDATWSSGAAACERACTVKPPMAGERCPAVGLGVCYLAADFNGELGCCGLDGNVIRWTPCD